MDDLGLGDSCVCVSMCVCVNVCVCVCVCERMGAWTHVCVLTNMCVCERIYVCVWKHMCVCVGTHMCVCVNEYVSAPTASWRRPRYVCLYFGEILHVARVRITQQECSNTHICTHTHIHTSTHTHTSVHTHLASFLFPRVSSPLHTLIIKICKLWTQSPSLSRHIFLFVKRKIRKIYMKIHFFL